MENKINIIKKLFNPSYSSSKMQVSGAPAINIYKKLTLVNFTKCSYTRKPVFIVIHYVGATSTAANNAEFFYKVNRDASAHYFVDHEIWQVVEDNDISWSCGGGLQGSGGASFYKICGNSNCVAIEMCCKKDANGKWYFEDTTVKNTIALTNQLMEKYKIDIDHVIRHFDVTGKICPEPYVRDGIAWENFKKMLINQPQQYWAEDILEKLVEKGIINSPELWRNYKGYVPKSNVVRLIDGCTGGLWTSPEDDSSMHWVQPYVISLCGKGIISDKTQWLTNPDANISKALLLAIICKATGGVYAKYANRTADHWARNCLDTLCDRGIIVSPEAWSDDFEAPVSRENTMALIYAAFITKGRKV